MGGNCQRCPLQHQISEKGYRIRCIDCGSAFPPRNALIQVDGDYPEMKKFWAKYQALSVNNSFGSEEEIQISCDVNLDNRIFGNGALTTLYNQILDGHKIVKISELLQNTIKNFKYSNGQWYHFDGCIWSADKE